MKGWSVVDSHGKIVGSQLYLAKTSAVMIAECFNRSDRRFSGPYRVRRAKLILDNPKKRVK